MSLLNLKSIFSPENTTKFQDNQPNGAFDTKLNYNQSSLIGQTYGFDISISPPTLDSLLRGRVYNQTQFSQNFTNDNLFVKPETGEIEDSLFRTQTFDPRATTPKEGTLYFNTSNSFNPATNPTDFSTAVGNNESSYTPLSQLGVSFYNGENSDKNLSWESLYNSNHTPKNNPKWQGGNLEALNYGSIVNRDNLKIGKRDHVIGERYGFSRGDEPYVVSPIGNEGREKNKGGRSVPITRALTDGDRILNFLTSTEGINFALRQNINIPIENTVFSSKNIVTKEYGLFRSPQRFGVTYNPLASLVAASARALGQSIPNVLTRKSGFDLGADVLGGIGSAIGGKFGENLNTVADLLSPTEYKHSPANLLNGLPTFSINDTFTSGLPEEGGIFSQIGDALSSLNPLNPGTVVPKTTVGDKMTLAKMFSGGDSLISLPTIGTTIERGLNVLEWKAITADVDGESDGMPFYFKDLRDDTYIFFRAFIEGLTENISPTYAPTNYIGRSEPVWTYERAEREISMTLKLVAQTRDELTEIYKKMDRLTSMCYPKYEDDDYGNRMKPPLSKLRYGELYGKTNKELMGYLKSISYSIDQSSTYETESGARVPKHVLATIGYQVIHDKAPRLGTKFYGINQ